MSTHDGDLGPRRSGDRRRLQGAGRTRSCRRHPGPHQPAHRRLKHCSCAVAARANAGSPTRWPRTSGSSISTGLRRRPASSTAVSRCPTDCRCTPRVVLRARPDVRSVVHAHPPAVVAADLAGLGVRPIVGAFDIPGLRLAAGGVPVYPRGVLVRNRRLAGEMVAALGDRAVVVLRAHGLTSNGQCRAGRPSGDQRGHPVQAGAGHSSLPAVSWRICPVKTSPSYPTWVAAFNTDTAWRHELASGLSTTGSA